MLWVKHCLVFAFRSCIIMCKFIKALLQLHWSSQSGNRLLRRWRFHHLTT